MQARDIMTRNVITVGSETSVSGIAALLIEHRISGVPVVDFENRVVGIVSEGDLYRRIELGTEKRRSRWAELLTPNAELAIDYVAAHGRTALDVMTSPAIHVMPSTPIAAIADLFETHRITRVPVLDGETLVGIVTRSNLVQALASLPRAMPAAAVGDAAIRDAVMAEYARHPWGKHSQSNVVVSDGVVHLWGLVDTAAERAALLVAAERVPGVRYVADHTILTWDREGAVAHRGPALGFLG